jgi:hypothetical protein
MIVVDRLYGAKGQKSSWRGRMSNITAQRNVAGFFVAIGLSGALWVAIVAIVINYAA